MPSAMLTISITLIICIAFLFGNLICIVEGFNPRQVATVDMKIIVIIISFE